MKKQLLLLLFPFFTFSQVQIGQDIDGSIEDRSGLSVSLSSDGSIVAIGAPSGETSNVIPNSGSISIYQNVNNVWTQIGQEISGEATSDEFGSSISISGNGNIVAVGAPLNDGNGGTSGHIRIYENNNGTWTQIGQDIDGESPSDQFGFSVSLSVDGSIVAVGAPGNDNANGIDSGHVRIYENINGTWTQVGEDIDGEATGDLSGFSVSLSSNGNIVAIGAGNNDDNGVDSGHVRIYENISGTWTQIGQDINGEAANDASGARVNLSGDGTVVAIGAPFNDGVNGTDSGHVRIYENISGTWTQIGQDIDGEAVDDESGFAISLSSNGNIVAIGASRNDGDGSDINFGHVRVYENVSGAWTQIGSDIDGENDRDRSGFAVSLASDGNTLAVGAPFNDVDPSNGSGQDSGQVRVFDISGITLSTGDIINNSDFSLFPNPASEILNISNLKNIDRIEVYNLLGQKVSNYEGDSISNNSINISNLDQGLYLVRVISDNTTETFKIEKQ